MIDRRAAAQLTVQPLPSTTHPRGSLRDTLRVRCAARGMLREGRSARPQSAGAGRSRGIIAGEEGGGGKKKIVD